MINFTETNFELLRLMHILTRNILKKKIIFEAEQNRTEHTLYFSEVIHNMTCEVQTNKQMYVAATKYQIFIGKYDSDDEQVSEV